MQHSRTALVLQFISKYSFFFPEWYIRYPDKTNYRDMYNCIYDDVVPQEKNFKIWGEKIEKKKFEKKIEKK